MYNVHLYPLYKKKHAIHLLLYFMIVNISDILRNYKKSININILLLCDMYIISTNIIIRKQSDQKPCTSIAASLLLKAQHNVIYQSYYTKKIYI